MSWPRLSLSASAAAGENLLPLKNLPTLNASAEPPSRRRSPERVRSGDARRRHARSPSSIAKVPSMAHFPHGRANVLRSQLQTNTRVLLQPKLHIDCKPPSQPVLLQRKLSHDYTIKAQMNSPTKNPSRYGYDS